VARSFRIVQMVLIVAKVKLQKVCVCVFLKSLFHERQYVLLSKYNLNIFVYVFVCSTIID
jgi:hypothetical protein